MTPAYDERLAVLNLERMAKQMTGRRISVLFADEIYIAPGVKAHGVFYPVDKSIALARWLLDKRAVNTLMQTFLHELAHAAGIPGTIDGERQAERVAEKSLAALRQEMKAKGVLWSEILAARW